MGNQIRCGAGRVTPHGVPGQLVQKINWKTDHGAAGAELPEELITEILLCSSAKSLLRFRCVSKSFCSVIDSDEFICLNHNRSIENKRHRKLIIRESPRLVHSFDVDNRLEEKIKGPPPEKSPKPYGYCNGLILLLFDSYKLALWNPSTQQYRNLPPCPVPIPPTGGHYGITGMGLGYDYTHHDYKVVLIGDVKTDNNTYVLQVWIFGLRSNLWKRIQNFPYRKDKFIYFGYFAAGYVHWLCKPSGSPYALVVFDVAKETISSKPLSLANSHRLFVDLHVLDESLCMSYFSTNPEQFGFYVREKDGTEGKWRELFSLTPDVPLFFNMSRFKKVRVLGYSKAGDKVMMDLGFKFIVLYDLKEKIFRTTENIKLAGVVDPRKLCNYPFLCVESLVSVDGGDLGQKSGKKRKNRA